MKAPRIFGGDERADSGYACMLSLYCVAVRYWTKLTHPFRAEWRRRPLGDERESAWELDDVERVRIHVDFYTKMAKPELAKIFAHSGLVLV